MEEAEQAFASGERVRNAPDKCQTCGQKNSSREIEPDELHSHRPLFHLNCDFLEATDRVTSALVIAKP